ncbi:MAG: hypothetical protein QOF89_6139 [Acidobacteriota bacterium]|nr:hypothetical protein [Acidobacteriota bacterium]
MDAGPFPAALPMLQGTAALSSNPPPLVIPAADIVFKNTSVEGDGFEGRPLQSGWIVTAGK